MSHTSVACTTHRGIPGWRGLLITLVGCSAACAANRAPDLLSLGRLDAMLASEAKIAQSDALPAEQPFVMAPPADESAATTVEANEGRRELQSWLNEYMQDQVLFRNSDLIALRQALASVSDEQLDRWTNDTQQLRQRLTTESWGMTQQWLRDFLAAQAIYSPEQIADLRRRMATLTPSELILVLDHFETVHVSRLRTGQASEQLRMQQLSLGGPMRTIPPAGRAASLSAGGDFPSSVGSQVARDRDRQYALSRRRSLSQRVSNFYVNQAVFGRAIWWAW